MRTNARQDDSLRYRTNAALRPAVDTEEAIDGLGGHRIGQIPSLDITQSSIHDQSCQSLVVFLAFGDSLGSRARHTEMIACIANYYPCFYTQLRRLLEWLLRASYIYIQRIPHHECMCSTALKLIDNIKETSLKLPIASKASKKLLAYAFLTYKSKQTGGSVHG